MYDDPFVGSAADLSGFVPGADLEGDDLALHGGDGGLRPDLQTHGGGAEVADVQLGADGGFGIVHGLFDGFTGGTLHQGNHAGRGVDQQGTGAYLLRGVLPLHEGADLTFHANSDLHISHILSDSNIPQIGTAVNEKGCYFPWREV